MNRPGGILLLVALLLVSFSCRSREKPLIGMTPKGSTHVFWQAVHAGAVKAAQEFQVELAWNAAASESDRSRQIAIIDSMINRRVDGMALAPVDRTALVAVVHRAIDAGIPVVVFDSGLDSERPLSYVATDNREGGRLAARRMHTLLNGKGKVAIIDDMPGSASTTERVNGFLEEMKSKAPGIELLPVQFNTADRAKARAITENLLTAHEDLGGIFADHEAAAIGAGLALKARENRKVKLVGFDSSSQMIDLLNEGWIDSLVVQDPFRMGYESVRTLARRLKGETPEKRIDTGSTLVVREDVDKPEVRRLLEPPIEQWLGKSAGQ